MKADNTNIKISPEFLKNAKALQKLVEDKKKLEEDLSNINKKLFELHPKLTEILEEFKLEGVENLKLKGIGTIFLHTSPQPSIKDQDSLFKDLRKRKLGSIIRETVHHQTLKGLVKELLEQGKPELQGVEIFYKKEARIR